jgi:hypothetical protein
VPLCLANAQMRSLPKTDMATMCVSNFVSHGRLKLLFGSLRQILYSVLGLGSVPLCLTDAQMRRLPKAERATICVINPLSHVKSKVPFRRLRQISYSVSGLRSVPFRLANAQMRNGLAVGRATII